MNTNKDMTDAARPTPSPSSASRGRPVEATAARGTLVTPGAGSPSTPSANSSAWITVAAAAGGGGNASRPASTAVNDTPRRAPDHRSSHSLSQPSLKRPTNSEKGKEQPSAMLAKPSRSNDDGETTNSCNSSSNNTSSNNINSNHSSNSKGSTQPRRTGPAASATNYKTSPSGIEGAPPPSASSTSKRSKKKHQKLKSISIGDMIKEPNQAAKKLSNNPDGSNTGKLRPHPAVQQQRQPFTAAGHDVTWQMDSVQDFPSLVAPSSVSRQSNQPASVAAPTGSATTPQNALPAVQQQPQPPPQTPSGSKPLPPPPPPRSTLPVPSNGASNNFRTPPKILQRGEPLPSPRQSADRVGGSSIQASKPGANKNSSNNGKNTNAKGNGRGSSTTKSGEEDPKTPRASTAAAAADVSAVSASPAKSAMDFFTPLARPSGNDNGAGRVSTSGGGHFLLDGDEHKLLRLMQERTVYQKKGRQRLAPRNKRFTPLKKRVLQERLTQWRESHPQEDGAGRDGSAGTAANAVPGSTTGGAPPLASTSLCIYEYARADEMEDDDEYEETVENLMAMATKIGPVDEICIPRPVKDSGGGDSDGLDTAMIQPVFVKFEKAADASAAMACWDGLLVGGTKLEVVYVDLSSSDDSGGGDDTVPWAERVVAAESRQRNRSTSDSSDADMVGPVEVVLQKVLTNDDYDDEECMAESLEDLKKVAQEFGEIKGVRPSEGNDGNVVLTYECSVLKARDIAASLCRVFVGGESLYAFVNELPIKVPVYESSSTILLENVLTEDDLEDEECMNEALNDIRELSMKYGNVSDVAVKGNGVMVTFIDGLAVAESAVGELDGLLLGGNVIAASLLPDPSTQTDVKSNNGSSVLLHNLLTQEDLEDEDCLEECLSDIRELASKYGVISNVDLLRVDAITSVRITFDASTNGAAEAVKGFDGMVIGGQIVSAALPVVEEAATQSYAAATESSGDKRKPLSEETTTVMKEKKARTDDKVPLYSGDRLIPERFAEMKRVPKVPNAPGPREYATIVNDERVKPLLTEMLGELMRLQKRAVEEKNAKARRRLVMGLREVARGIRAHKVKMVVMANNLDEYGAIDDKLQEIIDLAKSEGVPLFFEFTKRTLGKALGKSIKIAVVGIQNAEGAHQPFKKLNAIAGMV